MLIEGKEKLAADILLEAARPFEPADAGRSAKAGVKAKKKKTEKNPTDENPVRGVHFSSFIVQ